MTETSNSSDLRAALVSHLIEAGRLRTDAVRDAFLGAAQRRTHDCRDA
jgi:hypothetical protein